MRAVRVVMAAAVGLPIEADESSYPNAILIGTRNGKFPLAKLTHSQVAPKLPECCQEVTPVAEFRPDWAKSGRCGPLFANVCHGWPNLAYFRPAFGKYWPQSHQTWPLWPKALPCLSDSGQDEAHSGQVLSKWQSCGQCWPNVAKQRPRLASKIGKRCAKLQQMPRTGLNSPLSGPAHALELTLKYTNPPTIVNKK